MSLALHLPSECRVKRPRWLIGTRVAARTGAPHYPHRSVATDEATRSRARPRRVGHKGAADLAQGNTLASFDAALAHGVDMIEFDVLSERPDGSGTLLVAHDYEDMRSRTPLTLEQALDHLAGGAFAELEFDLDVKLPGYELRVVDALCNAGLTNRTLLSGMFPSSLGRVRAAEPSLRLGWSVPRVRRDYTSDMLTAIPALAMLTGYRALLPRRASEALRKGIVDAIMAHWRVVTPALVRAVARQQGELYVWTVDDAPRIAKLTRMGVSGIITNDPRLFSDDTPAMQTV